MICSASGPIYLKGRSKGVLLREPKGTKSGAVQKGKIQQLEGGNPFGVVEAVQEDLGIRYFSG